MRKWGWRWEIEKGEEKEKTIGAKLHFERMTMLHLTAAPGCV